MRRSLLGLAGALLVLVLIVAGISYSWTFQDLGRLDYRAAVFAKIAEWDTQPMDLSPEARAVANQWMGLPGLRPAKGVRFEERHISGPGGSPLPIRIYWPESPAPLPLYLEIHGGGWWMGDGFGGHEMMTHFAARAEAIVVAVDYRLAPEHPYPTALDDCYAALEWIHANAAELGGDADRIALGGSSAGGNLSAAVAIRARNQGGPKLRFQYLSVPAVDLSGTRSWLSYQETGDRYMLKVSEIQQMIEAYVPDPAMRSLPTVSPLLASDHRGLPPALVVTALFDPLRDQGEEYARVLEAAGVPVQHYREDAALHGFVGSPDRSLRVLKMAVRAALAARPSSAGGSAVVIENVASLASSAGHNDLDR